MGSECLPSIVDRRLQYVCSRVELIGCYLNSVSPDNWDRKAHPMTKNNFGVFEITIPPVHGQPAIGHNSKIKVQGQSSYLLKN